ncbi:hypothetical protein BEL04_22940 [Mucilaginibacter sp. PPCGB 2223]|uniref:hypothetical protein n=1 Tax=Mucilaginibacter sp. PPCGB 2223 TaxID=1886027 RepID=UPI000826CD64|nr:hypothetical protein [Mucilaginibacter sp. PPCGB 2223]OCX50631.1 hypothetical protein BEL04_22940 [Mucilaginibacter sp. PPCGB 2223]
MQKLYTTITLTLFITLITGRVLAQNGVPVSLRPDFNRMMANQSMQMSMNRMLNQRWYFGMDYLVNNEYKFKVIMKDSTVKEIKSKIHVDTVTHKSYLVFNDKSVPESDPKRYKKIYCDQTLTITRSEGIVNFTGLATDSCWLFRVLRGKISAYSHLSEIENINSDYLQAFQVGNGPIQKLDSAALAPVLKEDPKAFKLFMKKDFYKAITRYDGF